MTDEARTVKVGDRIRDNDPRMRGRTLVITSLFVGKRAEVGGAAVIQRNCMRVRASVNGDGTGETRIRLDRIHTDGEPRRSGWSLVQS